MLARDWYYNQRRRIGLDRAVTALCDHDDDSDLRAREALSMLDKDRTFLKAGGVFNDDFIDSFIELKMAEIMRLDMTPHPVEFDMYYSS